MTYVEHNYPVTPDMRRFKEPETLLFLNGAPLSGKSTIASFLGSRILDCTVQSMDMIRLISCSRNRTLPPALREPTLEYGSCDSYRAIGDGSYSRDALLGGYRQYSRATCHLLNDIIPGFEAQGTGSVVFEGVQLLPEIIGEYLVSNVKNNFIMVKSTEKKLDANRVMKYGAQPSLLTERYSTDKLLLIQSEIIAQAQLLPSEQVLTVQNTGTYVEAVDQIIVFLRNNGSLD